MDKGINTTPKPYLWHLTPDDDLVTSHEAIRAGFVGLALERNRRATPVVEQARALKAASASATPCAPPPRARAFARIVRCD